MENFNIWNISTLIYIIHRILIKTVIDQSMVVYEIYRADDNRSDVFIVNDTSNALQYLNYD